MSKNSPMKEATKLARAGLIVRESGTRNRVLLVNGKDTDSMDLNEAADFINAAVSVLLQSERAKVLLDLAEKMENNGHRIDCVCGECVAREFCASLCRARAREEKP